MKYGIYILFLLICINPKVNGQEYNLLVNTASDIPNEIVKSYENFRGDSLEIHNKLKETIRLLQNEGYVAASIDSVRFDSSFVYADLFRGKIYYWGNLYLSGLEHHLIDVLKLKSQLSKTIHLDDFRKIKNDILHYYENSGYPFTEVQIEDLEVYDSLFTMSLKVKKGDQYTLDSIIVKGDAKISDNYLRKKMRIDPGMTFDQKRINEIDKKIDNIPFISEIKPAEIEFEKESADLYLYLENKKANMFNGIIGFLPENEQSGDLLITGELKLNLLNSLKRGEEISLNWQKLESSTQKLDLAFMYPYLFKTNLGLDADFSLYKKDSTFLSMNAGLGLRLFLTYDNYIKFYYRYKNSSRIGDDESFVTSINLADVKSNIMGASYYLNQLDYKFNPRKGVELNIFAGAGFKNISGLNNVNDSLNLNTDNNTIELETGLNLDFYYPLYRNFVFHFENVSRYLDQFADEERDAVLFENELYRFGGANSLRGFDENIFYASIYSIQNAEIRYLFEKNSAFYVFWNGAYYYQNITESVTEDFPWGFGIGMDFQTKAGIFSLSYALGKQFDNPIEIRTAKIHFGYISRF